MPLICSELLEVDTRARLLGQVDLLLVPSWNTDTTSFEALVQSASLELHSFVAVANNGNYSDCRVRGPYADPWRRDASRLICRGHNETVVTDLPLGQLRRYRNNPTQYEIDRTPSWPRWKPTPPGMTR